MNLHLLPKRICYANLGCDLSISPCPYQGRGIPVEEKGLLVVPLHGSITCVPFCHLMCNLHYELTILLIPQVGGKPTIHCTGPEKFVDILDATKLELVWANFWPSEI